MLKEKASKRKSITGIKIKGIGSGIT